MGNAPCGTVPLGSAPTGPQAVALAQAKFLFLELGEAAVLHDPLGAAALLEEGCRHLQATCPLCRRAKRSKDLSRSCCPHADPLRLMGRNPDEWFPQICRMLAVLPLDPVPYEVPAIRRSSVSTEGSRPPSLGTSTTSSRSSDVDLTACRTSLYDLFQPLEPTEPPAPLPPLPALMGRSE